MRLPTATKDEWIPSIDGLRAVAVLAVLIHHANGAYISNFALGNVGVAIFFSISGFLAYLVLSRDERRFGHVNYSYFLMRRVLRIWPAYFAIIALVWLQSPTAGTTLQQVGLLTFTLNFQMQDHHWPLPGLEALWSISVEEQFYLLAPLMYLALRSRYAFAFVAAIVASANAIRFVYVSTSMDVAPDGGFYYATYAYIDTFVVGAAVAKFFIEGGAITRAQQLVASVVSVLLFMIILRLWGQSAFPPYPSYAAVPYALIPFAGALLLLCALPFSKTTITQFLSTAGMRWIGNLSYSLYLVHIFVLNQVQALNSPHFVQAAIYNLAFFSGTVLFALALHYTIERPFLILKTHARSQMFINCSWLPFLIWSAVIFGLFYLT